MSKGGPIQPVIVVTDAMLRQNGGRYILGAGGAIPIEGVDALTIAPNEDIFTTARIPIYIVENGVASRGVVGGEPIKVSPIATVAPGPDRGIKTRVARPVTLVRGALNTYSHKIHSVWPERILAHWKLNETGGLIAHDCSPHHNNGTYAGSGITYGVAGIGDGNTAIRFNGVDTYIDIDMTDPALDFDEEWDGNVFSMIAWGKVDAAARWTDATTYRYLQHVRPVDATYYAVMGKSQTSHQLEWRRRVGGPIVSQTYTFSPSGPTDWFCMGMTCDISIPEMRFFLYDSVGGWRKVGTSNSGNLTDWGNNPPEGGTTLLGAGSLTLQEWIGDEQHAVVWEGVALTDSQMALVMTP